MGLYIGVFQFCFTQLLRLILLTKGKLFKNIKLNPLDSSSRYVIASNHQSRLDPFVIGMVFSFAQKRKLSPIKYMLYPGLYHSILKPLFFSLGCYPAHAKYHPYHTAGVEGSIKLLGKGYNVCIFPEGRRTLQSESSPYNGISRILAGYTEANLILAHIEWERKGWWRRNVHVKVENAPPGIDVADPQKIMEAIYKL